MQKLLINIQKYLSSQRKEEGFTLVELIVVVVIIGILSSIAIPSFQKSSLKARQRSASVLVSTYIKAAQAYKTEYGLDAITAGDLKHYVAVNECTAVVDEIENCKNMSPETVQDNDRAWNGVDGYYRFYMEHDIYDGRVYILAAPHGSTAHGRNGFGVAGCFRASTGGIGITNYESPGNAGRNQDAC